MRSELVFRASDRVANRYLLCHATAKTTRCLHFVSANTADAITDAFVRMADTSSLAFNAPHATPDRDDPAEFQKALA
jgi:hypothetical protein